MLVCTKGEQGTTYSTARLSYTECHLTAKCPFPLVKCRFGPFCWCVKTRKTYAGQLLSQNRWIGRPLGLKASEGTARGSGRPPPQEAGLGSVSGGLPTFWNRKKIRVAGW